MIKYHNNFFIDFKIQPFVYAMTSIGMDYHCLSKQFNNFIYFHKGLWPELTKGIKFSSTIALTCVANLFLIWPHYLVTKFTPCF